MITKHSYPPLPRDFYDRDVVQVSRELIGKQLIHCCDGTVMRGRIVEAEAYLSAEDPACHAARGCTPRNAAMFGPPGHAYVYSIHARHCVNVVTEPAGVPSAVLIRAVEPMEGIELMQRRRGRQRLLELTRGPARLCEAFGINRQLDQWDLTRGQVLWVAGDEGFDQRQHVVHTSPRIGVTSAHELLLRFYLEGNRYVSRP